MQHCPHTCVRVEFLDSSLKLPSLPNATVLSFPEYLLYPRWLLFCSVSSKFQRRSWICVRFLLICRFPCRKLLLPHFVVFFRVVQNRCRPLIHGLCTYRCLRPQCLCVMEKRFSTLHTELQDEYWRKDSVLSAALITLFLVAVELQDGPIEGPRLHRAEPNHYFGTFPSFLAARVLLFYRLHSRLPVVW